MHDIKFIRDNPKIFNKKMNNRNVDISSENILKIDKKNRELISNLQIFQEERNLLSKQIGILIKDGKDVNKVQENVKKIKDQKKMAFDIEIDGGINFDNCKSAIDAGANILVSGTTVFKSNDGDIQKNINLLKLK